jgi:hypothetical protein
MRINVRILIFSSLVLIAILGCGLSAGAPSNNPAVEPVAGLPTAPLPTTMAPAFTPQPALPERRRLTLEYPPRIRLGDSDVVRLTLEVDDLGNITPTAQVEGNVVTGQVVEIPNVYESHNVIAEARFDIAGVEVRPPELASEPLTQGTSATFYWSVRPQETGVFRGTIWLYLRFVDKQSGEESRKTVSAQTVQLEAVNFLGLSANFARMTGMVGSVVGTVIGFPFFEEVIRFLFKRRNRRTS